MKIFEVKRKKSNNGTNYSGIINVPKELYGKKVLLRILTPEEIKQIEEKQNKKQNKKT